MFHLRFSTPLAAERAEERIKSRAALRDLSERPDLAKSSEGPPKRFRIYSKSENDAAVRRADCAAAEMQAMVRQTGNGSVPGQRCEPFRRQVMHGQQEAGRSDGV